MSNSEYAVALVLLVVGVFLMLAIITHLVRALNKRTDVTDESILGDYPKVPDFKPRRDAE